MIYRTLLITALALASAVSLCTAGDSGPVVHKTAPAEANIARYELDEAWSVSGFDRNVLIGNMAEPENEIICYRLRRSD